MIISIKQETYQRVQQFMNNIVFAEVGFFFFWGIFQKHNKNMNFRQFINNFLSERPTTSKLEKYDKSLNGQNSLVECNTTF